MGLSRAAWLVAISVLAGGCATIVKGQTTTVNINSSPQGAMARASNGVSILTPGQMVLKDDEDMTIVFEKAGYQTTEVRIHSVLSPWLFGDIIFGGLIGMAIDLASGSAWKLSPSEVNTVLPPAQPASQP